MTSPGDRTLLLEMAMLWSRLAEYAAKNAVPKVRVEPEVEIGRIGRLSWRPLSLQPLAVVLVALVVKGKTILFANRW